MTREECEKAIKEKLMEIRRIYEEYNENGDYLSATIWWRKEGSDINAVTANNTYYKSGHPDYTKPINFWEELDEQEG